MRFWWMLFDFVIRQSLAYHCTNGSQAHQQGLFSPVECRFPFEFAVGGVTAQFQRY
jgi:hypothetical protein